MPRKKKPKFPGFMKASKKSTGLAKAGFSRKEHNPTIQHEAKESTHQKHPMSGHKDKQKKLTARTIKGRTMQSPYAIASDITQSQNY